MDNILARTCLHTNTNSKSNLGIPATEGEVYSAVGPSALRAITSINAVTNDRLATAKSRPLSVYDGERGNSIHPRDQI